MSGARWLLLARLLSAFAFVSGAVAAGVLQIAAIRARRAGRQAGPARPRVCGADGCRRGPAGGGAASDVADPWSVALSAASFLVVLSIIVLMVWRPA